MSTLFNLKIPAPEKFVTHHPWERVIKDNFASKVKYAHNSINNPKYPREEDVKPKTKTLVVPKESRIRFTIVGNRVTKEFIYCVNIVKGLHKYRQKNFDPPIIRGVTSVEWPTIWNDLKIRYGELAFCLNSQVAVVMNDTFLGGENELKDLIESKYVYHLCLDYYKEGVNQFATYVRSSGRPCAYLHFSINDEEAGCMVFMLYSDILPYTCDNFLRLCRQTKGGYGGTPVHRIVKDGWIQCGGYGLKSNDDLGCENFQVPHDRRGVLCMANDGRNVDCSTQFFVLLHPAPWMAYKYVAFGQLIDGESTLQKIEQVPTFYESPTKNVTIIRSGIFNMDCQDIMINKKTKEFIFGHIEDLNVIGELFYEALLENVFAEIDRREQQVLATEMVGEGEMTTEGDLIKDSKRFIRNKEDIQQQIGKTKGATSEPVSKPALPDQDFADQDDYKYEYEGEGSIYQHASVGPAASMIVRPERPFYLPLTDVPYPDEVDSTYDLKKLLKGDYCHEVDLGVRREPKKTEVAYPSEVFLVSDSSDESAASVELDSEEEREIKIYLSQNVDRVSFAGGVVKKISKRFAKLNIFDGPDLPEVFTVTDECLRRVKTLSPEYHSKQEKKVSVSINVEDAEKVHHKIKRRQTGFVRPTELERIRMVANLREPSDDDEDVASVSKSEKRVTLQSCDDEDPNLQTKVKRRQTGFSRTASSMHRLNEAYDGEGNYRKVSVGKATPKEIAEKKANRRSGFVRSQDLAKIHVIDRDEWDDENDRKVRITAKQPSATQQHEVKHKHISRRPTGFVRPMPHEDDNSDIDIHRPSVLQRLYQDVAVDDDEDIVPTLKDYKPRNEVVPKKYNLLTTEKIRLNDINESKEYFRPSMYSKEASNDIVLNLQHGKKLARKISTDYVNTIDQIEKRQHNSIRSVEFAKSRPALSVTDYQRRNSKYQEELRNTFKHQVKKNRSEDSSVGLRLPGDTPLYMDDSAENLKQVDRRVQMVRSKLSSMLHSKLNVH